MLQKHVVYRLKNENIDTFFDRVIYLANKWYGNNLVSMEYSAKNEHITIFYTLESNNG